MKPGRLSVSHLNRTFSFSLPNASRRAANLSWGTCPSGLFLLMGGKNQPCKMKLLIKRPKNSTKQWQKKYLVGRKQKAAHLRALKDRSKGNEKNPLACRVHELQTVKILILGISIIIGAGKHDNYSIFLMTICKRG